MAAVPNRVGSVNSSEKRVRLLGTTTEMEHVPIECPCGPSNEEDCKMPMDRRRRATAQHLRPNQALSAPDFMERAYATFLPRIEPLAAALMDMLLQTAICEQMFERSRVMLNMDQTVSMVNALNQREIILARVEAQTKDLKAGSHAVREFLLMGWNMNQFYDQLHTLKNQYVQRMLQGGGDSGGSHSSASSSSGVAGSCQSASSSSSKASSMPSMESQDEDEELLAPPSGSP